MSLRNFSMDEWDSMSDEMKLLAAVSAGSRIRELEICAGDERRLLDETRDHADIQRRRIEIAQFILHEACMKDRLEKVAAVLWPSPASVIDKPSSMPGILSGVELLNEAATLLDGIIQAATRAGIELGDWPNFVKRWNEESNAWKDTYL